jgi:serine protease
MQIFDCYLNCWIFFMKQNYRSICIFILIAIANMVAGCGGSDGGGSPQANVAVVPSTTNGAIAPPTSKPPTTADDTNCDTKDRVVRAAEMSSRVPQTTTGLIVTLSPVVAMGAGAHVMAAQDAAQRIAGVIERATATPPISGNGARIYTEARASAIPRFERMLSASTALVSISHGASRSRFEELLNAIAVDPDVLGVEPDDSMVLRATPNDPDFDQQWNFSSGNAGIDLPAAWDITTGRSSVVTAVLDTGYVAHADVVGNLLPGYSFVSSIPTSNNGRSRGPDATDPGDWVTHQESSDISSAFYNCDPRASSWHGTKVAGLIGATANNGIGVAGVNWYSKILPVRVLGKCGGKTSDIVDGLRWAAGIPVAGVPTNSTPAKVINLSFGGTGPCGDALQQAIDDVIATGASVVVAAGNDGIQTSQDRPANCRGVIAVGSTDKTGHRAWNSNFGADISLSAPGANILLATNMGATVPQSDAYGADSGTSFAAPQVAGVISLMLSANPTLTPKRIMAILKQTARPAVDAAAQSCHVRPPGAGILDAAAAVAAAQNTSTDRTRSQNSRSSTRTSIG